MTHRLTWLAAAAATFALAAPAQAALVPTDVSCSGQSTTMTGLPGYLGCSGAWLGNNLNQGDDVAAQIAADWGLNGLTALNVTGSNTGSTGTIDFGGAQSGLFVLALKAGDAFSLYEFDGSGIEGGISSIAYDTLGVGFHSPGNDMAHYGQGLSHATLYAVPVPEPETYALMLAGLAALALVKKRPRR